MALDILYTLVILLCVGVPLLYELQPKSRYAIKFVFYYAAVLLTALIIIPVIVFRPGAVRNTKIASYILAPVSQLLGIKWELRGKEYLEKEQACVLVCNHQTSLDFLGMLHMWPTMDKCAAIAKKELFYIWPFGLTTWLCGTVFINRADPNAAHSTMNAVAEKTIKNKMKLWVFPEGTRSNTGTMKSFKKGAFRVAIDGQIPILPVVFSSYRFLKKEEKFFGQGKVIITCLPPIPTEGLTKDDMDDLMKRTWDTMQKTLESSTSEACSQCVQ